MGRCQVDKSIERQSKDGFDFPLGVYPVEEMTPRPGYTLSFEPADGGGEDLGSDDAGDQGDGLEEWPDRYVWDISISASRLEALCRQLFAMLPGRVYPILDVLGADAYRELDPYVGAELVGLERLMEGVRLFRGFLFEDGLVGFGAMSDEPFFYVFIDEHKVVTVRAEVPIKDKVERVLAAFDLTEVDQIAAADAAMHEHRSVLEAPEGRPDLLTADEIVEELRDMWGLYLNVDGEKNADESGQDLGMVGWRCTVRAMTQGENLRYAEILLTAENLFQAQELAVEAVERMLNDDGLIGTPTAGGGGGPRGGRPASPARPTEDDPEEFDLGGVESEFEESEPGEPAEGEDAPTGRAEDGPGFDVLNADRIRPEDFREIVEKATNGGPVDPRAGSSRRSAEASGEAATEPFEADEELTVSRVWVARWIE